LNETAGWLETDVINGRVDRNVYNQFDQRSDFRLKAYRQLSQELHLTITTTAGLKHSLPIYELLIIDVTG
jgi:hypothetical protein